MTKIEMHSQSDYRGMRLLPGRTVSVFFHDQRHYPCPDCKGELDRAHIHGWYWSCAQCKKTFPLYVLQNLGIAEETKIPDKTFMQKLKGVFNG
jgi:ribosomal protein L37AE/L43A